jgi:hypothetical protein
MSADNHRGQEAKIFHEQAAYMRVMIFFSTKVEYLANGLGSTMPWPLGILTRDHQIDKCGRQLL